MTLSLLSPIPKCMGQARNNYVAAELMLSEYGKFSKIIHLMYICTSKGWPLTEFNILLVKMSICKLPLTGRNRELINWFIGCVFTR